jgi:hypothetical protein
MPCDLAGRAMDAEVNRDALDKANSAGGIGSPD